MDNWKKIIDERNEMLNQFNVQIYAIDSEGNGLFDVVVAEDDGGTNIVEIYMVKEEELPEAINDAHVHFMAWFVGRVKEDFKKLGKGSQVGLLTELFNSLTRKQEDEFLTEIENDLYRYFMMQGKLIH